MTGLLGCDDPAVAPPGDSAARADLGADLGPSPPVDVGVSIADVPSSDVPSSDVPSSDVPSSDVPSSDVPSSVVNPVVIENARLGTDAWRITLPARHHEIEAYASATSAVAGEPFALHVNVDVAHPARWEAYRMGYYQGLFGRLVASGAARPIAHQADCPLDAATGMVECRWAAAFTVVPDASWISGEYLLKLVRDDGRETYVPLIVREAAPRAPLVFQASVNTWQAYNDWGGTSLYGNARRADGFTGEHAYRVSFDRPYSADDDGSGQVLWWEVFMVRWLEQRGYDVSYVTNVDVDADPAIALRRRMFLSVGHDEYWTTGERDALERARDAGVSLGFFTADTGTYHVLYADSSAGAPRRAVTCFKVDGEAHDPDRGTARQTTRFALAPLSRPENALLGVMYAQWTGGARFPMVVADPTHWIYAGTHVARGETLGFVVGSEFDRVHDNGFTPAGLEVVTASPGLSIEGVVDVSNATVYYPTPTSLVFAGGTLSWAQGLARSQVADPRIQRMTENILARAGLPLAAPTVVPPAEPPINPGTAASVTLLAGSGAAGYLDGPAALARFDAPAGVAAATDGTVYVVDSRNHRVRAVRPDGSVATLAGCGPTGAARSHAFRDGAGADACFDAPTGIAVGPDGTVYVADTRNNRVRAITPAGVVSTYAGTGDPGSADATDRRATAFSSPRGLAFGPDGALYVADQRNGAVRRIASTGVTTVAVGLDGPAGLAVGPDGRIYVTCSDGTLRTVSGGNTVLAGAPGDFDYVEGPGADARLRPGDGLAVLGARLVFADANNHRVRSFALDGTRRVTTLVGDGRAGAGIGTGGSTRVVLPRGLTPYRDGLALADSANHRVLLVRP